MWRQQMLRTVMIIRHFGAFNMQGENLERWQKLCQEAAGERDRERLMQLISEIDRMLAEKSKRLRQPHNSQQDAA